MNRPEPPIGFSSWYALYQEVKNEPIVYVEYTYIHDSSLTVKKIRHNIDHVKAQALLELEASWPSKDELAAMERILYVSDYLTMDEKIKVERAIKRMFEFGSYPY